MKDIVIIGAGGLGREVAYLLDELNSRMKQWNLLGFIDDNPDLQNTFVGDYPVLGDVKWLMKYSKRLSVICGIAKPAFRINIMEMIRRNPLFDYPNIIADNVILSKRVQLGIGNIILYSTTFTVDISIGNFNIINPGCTIGHDVVIKDYVTVYPGVNISGNVKIDQAVEIGTGSQIIQGLSICSDTIIGAGGVVIRNIKEKGTYVGVPVRKLSK